MNTQAGSSQQTEPAFVLVGHLQRSHGLWGEINMQVLTDFPERIRKGSKLYLGEAHTEEIVEAIRPKIPQVLIKFVGIDTPEAARELTNLDVYTSVKTLPALPKGKYYHHQLLGMQVYEGEQLLGVLADILATGANDVYVIDEPDGKELLLPAIPTVILKIDLDAQRMEVHVPEGLRG